MIPSSFDSHLARVQAGESLTADESADAFAAIMQGAVAEEALEDFLAMQSRRGPTVPEIVGAARTMRANMLTIEAPPEAIDLCGTGGDGHGTLNISTAVSFVVAACGVPVAKHGNRSLSSRTGAADVLQALGVKVSIGPNAAAACLEHTGICFLFAPTYHPAMRHVAPVRKRLGIRTIFNLLGPLCNPARVRRQLMGVYAREWLEPLAQVLSDLGSERAWVVHGSDGLDELTTTGTTHVVAIHDTTRTVREVAPNDIGVPQSELSQLRGGDAEHNCAAIRRLLTGADKGAYRDIVVLNAAAGLVVAGKAEKLAAAAELAVDAIDSGKALRVLERLKEISNSAA
jgi:anthranilate phosphoribosyltransferase